MIVYWQRWNKIYYFFTTWSWYSGIVQVAKSAYKIFKVGAKVLPKMISIAGFSNAVFRAISGCCVDYPEACEGNNEIMKLQEEIRKKSMEFDELQLGGKD